MRVIILLPFAALLGFLGHLTRPLVKREFSQGGTRFDGWFAIVSYVLGVLFTFPIFIILLWNTVDMIRCDQEKPRLDSLLAVATGCFFGAFGGVGAGTVLGHWLLPDN